MILLLGDAQCSDGCDSADTLTQRASFPCQPDAPVLVAQRVSAAWHGRHHTFMWLVNVGKHIL